jgi:HAD superfamily hydrolase (TIGR01484 family)
MSKTEMIIFDLDGTLAISKSPIDSEMADLLKQLTDDIKVAIISGGDYPQFQKQVVPLMEEVGANMQNLYLCPTCATKFYIYENEWKKLYSEDLTSEEIDRIINAFNKALEITGFKPEMIWGEQIENRGTQVTFSALGQQAPIEAKETWDPNFAKRQKIKAELDKLIPEFSIRLGGTTSVDITKEGVDKAYGIQKLKEVTNVDLDKMLFIGDALMEGGNDYPVKTTGVKCIETKSAENTKEILREFIKSGFDKEFNN